MKKNYTARVSAIVLFFTASVCNIAFAQQPARPAGGAGADPDRPVEGGGVFPAGWSVRTDANRRTNTEPPASQVVFTSIADGFHTTLGPASTFYNPTWTRTGDYQFSARFTQLKKPTHPIAYGLYIGGSDLGGPNQSYAYFMVRNTGEYLVKLRKGTETPVISNWSANDAVNKQDDNGKQVNVLGVQVQGNNVIFMINGKEVGRATKAELPADGLYGFRIDHNLDVNIDQIKR